MLQPDQEDVRVPQPGSKGGHCTGVPAGPSDIGSWPESASTQPSPACELPPPHLSITLGPRNPSQSLSPCQSSLPPSQGPSALPALRDLQVSVLPLGSRCCFSGKERRVIKRKTRPLQHKEKLETAPRETWNSRLRVHKPLSRSIDESFPGPV